MSFDDWARLRGQDIREPAAFEQPVRPRLRHRLITYGGLLEQANAVTSNAIMQTRCNLRFSCSAEPSGRIRKTPGAVFVSTAVSVELRIRISITLNMASGNVRPTLLRQAEGQPRPTWLSFHPHVTYLIQANVRTGRTLTAHSVPLSPTAARPLCHRPQARRRKVPWCAHAARSSGQSRGTPAVRSASELRRPRREDDESK
jgi:hypothetical protein